MDSSGLRGSEIRRRGFDYGRNYGVVYDVTSWTDVLPEFGGDTYGSDNFLQSRANGVATHRNSDFFGLVDGLNFCSAVPGKNGSVSGEDQTNNGRDFQKQNGEGFGTSELAISGTASALVTRVPSSKRTDEQNNSTLCLKTDGGRYRCSG